MTSSPLLQVREISKHFPGVQALDRVNLVLRAGEVLAVVGENGAGKSTLMKILAGIYPPDVGQILLDGQVVAFNSVRDALQRGISLIHQELNLAENLSAAANLFLGQERLWGGRLGLLDRRAMDRDAGQIFARLGLTVSPATRVSDLAVGQRQLVEIARSLALKARVLIMDEPTSSLTQAETDRLFEVIAQLRRDGVAVVYISHRLAEVERVADRALVLRDGRNVGELSRQEISHAGLVRLMVGREVSQFFPKKVRATSRTNPPRLKIHNLQYACGSNGPIGRSPPLSLELFGGEIAGLAGLVGAGRTELAECLFGIRSVLAGTIFLDGRPVRPRSPHQAIAAGLLLAPEDRRLHGLVLTDTVQHNLGLPNLESLSMLRCVAWKREADLARRMCGALNVRTPSIRQTVGLLSGGNQQKIVLGKWLARKPRMLILDEPTRGVDVVAKTEIYRLMDELAGQGVAVLMISSDLEEILGMSDRVLVMHQGSLAGELPRDQMSEQAIMHLATGGERKPTVEEARS